MVKQIWIENRLFSFRELEQNLGRKKFEELLIEHIKKSLSRYQMYIYDINVSLIGEEYIDMLCTRDNLEDKLNELNKTREIKEFQKTLDELDKQFKEQKEVILKKFGGLAESPTAPKTQWWNHLKTFDSE